ncbi:MAG: TorF family putative porin [Luteimonas sp.]
MLRGGGLLLTCLVAAPACAQVSGSVTLLSDARYHGASLSDGDPTMQLALAWDGADGWYAGAQGTRVRFAYPGAPVELQAEPYLGYVHALRPGRSIEAGAQYTWYSKSGFYNYPEFYVAASGERLRGRLAWMPRYFGQSAAWYAQIDGNRPLHGRFYAIAHAGALHEGSGDFYGYASKGSWRYDAALGIGVARSGFDLQVSWTTSNAEPEDPCIPWQCGARSAWVLRLSRGW